MITTAPPSSRRMVQNLQEITEFLICLNAEITETATSPKLREITSTLYRRQRSHFRNTGTPRRNVIEKRYYYDIRGQSPSSMGESFFSPCTRHVSMFEGFKPEFWKGGLGGHLLLVCLSRGYYLVTNLIISFTICLYIDVILILILYDAVRQYIVTSLLHQCLY